MHGGRGTSFAILIRFMDFNHRALKKQEQQVLNVTFVQLPEQKGERRVWSSAL
jgi:hypothetical protein